ncbi:MAG: YgiQ family radical SAM protein, partial [Christensenellales bacterium]
TPGGKMGARPDRATIVYCNRIREAFGAVPIIIGGIEASLRRFAHYDYWEDGVRRSILADSGADILVYGMGERQIVELACRLAQGASVGDLRDISGTCFITDSLEELLDYEFVAGFEDVRADRKKYAKAFYKQYINQDALSGKRLVQAHGKDYLVQNPPAIPLSQQELDRVYELPFLKEGHPAFDYVPAVEEVRFSLVSSRGCYGGCSFCALSFHQGRVVAGRSHDSLVAEAERMTELSGFKGNIHDVGGPTANFRQPACARQRSGSACMQRRCLQPEPCPALEVDHRDYVGLLRKLRQVPGVKRVFIRSGLRYDYMLQDRDDVFLRELVQHHVSGQLKIAPEHIDDTVLAAMGKPSRRVFEAFLQKYEEANKSFGKKQFVVPYFMSSHPGSDLRAAIALACYLKEKGLRIQQVQDFYPTPGTISTCMYYTGLDPMTLREVYVPKDYEEKGMQRALLQYYRKENHGLVRKALIKAGRKDLIGTGKNCLVPPALPNRSEPRPAKSRPRKEQAFGGRGADGSQNGKGRRKRWGKSS